jgi:hypothetical protein
MDNFDWNSGVRRPTCRCDLSVDLGYPEDVEFEYVGHLFKDQHCVIVPPDGEMEDALYLLERLPDGRMATFFSDDFLYNIPEEKGTVPKAWRVKARELVIKLEGSYYQDWPVE